VLDDCEVLLFNAAEVARKLSAKGMSDDDIFELLTGMNLELVAGDEDHPLEQAIQTGLVAARNRKLGLSIGDAACLVTASRRGQKAVTADRTCAHCEWPAEFNGPELAIIR
jgi:PIN domain nuclease of toxin-antitoxin system